MVIIIIIYIIIIKWIYIENPRSRKCSIHWRRRPNKQYGKMDLKITKVLKVLKPLTQSFTLHGDLQTKKNIFD